MDRKDFIKGATCICGYGLLQSVMGSCVNDRLVEPDYTPPVSAPTAGIQTNTTGNTTAGDTTVTTPPPPANTGATYTNGVLTLDLSSSNYSSLKTTGASVSIYQFNLSIIVANTPSGYVALSILCTHKGCPVEYVNSIFFCPCHSGYFDVNGNVTSGPPPRPLKKYTTSLSGNLLSIS